MPHESRQHRADSDDDDGDGDGSSRSRSSALDSARRRRLHQQSSEAASRSDSRRSDRSNSARHTRASSTAPTTSSRSQQLYRQLTHRDSGALRVSDRKLVKTARAAAASVDWSALRDASAAWRVKKRTGAVVGGGEFTITAHRQEAVQHVMATGSLTCSVAEMAHILWATRDERFLAAMSEFHGAHFLSGAVVHTVDSFAATSSAPPPDARATPDVDVSVKTATFAKAHVFARDEQWCFVDLFEMQPDRSRFLLTLQSLPPEDVLLDAAAATDARAESSRSQLHHITAGYSVVADPRGDFVWVAFYARFVDVASSSGASSAAAIGHRASRSATKARLVKMASALCNLPAIVQRRRLGAQVFANPKALVKPPNNSHCKCCTAALTLLVHKKRCHLCGYRVCAKCSAKQQIERAHRRNAQMVRVCTKCTQRVNAANYDDLPPGLASPLGVKPDASVDALAPPGKSLADYLRRSFERAADDVPRKRALMQIAKSLLEDEHSSGRSRSDTTGSRSRVEVGDSARSYELSDAKLRVSEIEFLDRVERELAAGKPYALEDCEVAHADDARSYSLDFADGEGEGGSADSVAKFPVPSDEPARADFVQRLADLTDLPELEIICAIASQELQCAAGLVTLLVGDSIHIVASSARDFQGVVVPREHSICSHLPMSDKPLLVTHPAADIRFSRIPAVHDGAVRFYCGFPLRTRDNVVFGAVCCVDSKPSNLTQSEYTIMAKLAGIASRIMETRCAAWVP